MPVMKNSSREIAERSHGGPLHSSRRISVASLRHDSPVVRSVMRTIVGLGQHIRAAHRICPALLAAWDGR